MVDTYRDGVQMERCLFCGGAVRGADGAPVVNLLVSDVEALILVLNGRTDYPVGLHLRLEQAAGRTYRQIAASEAIPSHVRTDRGGLEQ